MRGVRASLVLPVFPESSGGDTIFRVRSATQPRHKPMISIIICSVNDAKFAAISANYASLLRADAYEMIRIPDAKSLAEGYNRGIAQSQGEVLIFCHDDIEILADDFHAKLERALQSLDVVGVAGTDRVLDGRWMQAGYPYVFGQIVHQPLSDFLYVVDVFGAPARQIANVQALDGLFIAARRAVIDSIRFDAETFDGFHLYDIDFSFSAYLAGYRVGVRCDFGIIHRSGGKFDQRWDHYFQRFNQKFSGRLSTMSPRHVQRTRVGVNSKTDLMEVMNPRYWTPE
jgi:hypothetical protein